jgi:hypothetical protein
MRRKHLLPSTTTACVPRSCADMKPYLEIPGQLLELLETTVK